MIFDAGLLLHLARAPSLCARSWHCCGNAWNAVAGPFLTVFGASQPPHYQSALVVLPSTSGPCRGAVLRSKARREARCHACRCERAEVVLGGRDDVVASDARRDPPIAPGLPTQSC